MLFWVIRTLTMRARNIGSSWKGKYCESLCAGRGRACATCEPYKQAGTLDEEGTMLILNSIGRS